MLGVWRGKNIVVIDKPTTAAATTGTTVTFTSLAPSSLAACNGSGGGVCMTLDGATRVDVGQSAGGIAVSRALEAEPDGDHLVGDGKGMATGYLIGGAFKSDTTTEDDVKHERDEVAGFTGWGLADFGRQIHYHIWNSNFTRISGASGDDEGSYDDPNATFLRADGDANGASFIGSKGAKSGIGIVTNLEKDSECLNYVATSAPVTFELDTQFEVDKGCFIAQGMRPGGGNGYVADTASHVDLTGSYLLGTDVYYESANAQGKTSTLGATVTTGANNLINLSIDPDTDVQTPAPAPAEGTDLQIVQADRKPARILQDSFGETSLFTGRRADGSNAAKVPIQNDTRLAYFGGTGYYGANGGDPAGYLDEMPAGLGVNSCENWLAGETCAAATLWATPLGSTTPQEVARADAHGFGIGTFGNVATPLEVLSGAGATTLTSAFGTGGTDAAVVSTTGFPQTGIMQIGSEIIAYSVTDGTTLHAVSRGVWGTSTAGHSSGDSVSYFTVLDGSADSALPNFAVTSNGNMWWSGHSVTAGAAPTLSGTGVTTASLEGNDNAGRVTWNGTAPGVGETMIVQFAQKWAVGPVCFAQIQNASASNPLFITSVNRSQVAFKFTAAGTTNTQVGYSCTGYR